MAGLRERRKDEKRQTIIAAAREVFRSQGFFEATTAEIAKRAAVGTATLYRYAADKNELLLMAVSDELAAVENASIARIPHFNRRRSLVSQIVEYYRPRLEYWYSDIEMARVYAQVYVSLSPEHKPERARLGIRHQQLLSGTGKILTDYARANGLELQDDAEAVARTLHAAYVGELHPWLAERNPKLKRPWFAYGGRFASCCLVRSVRSSRRSA